MQESRWFGRDVWPATGGCTFLHSGRPFPDSGDPVTRNEGVGILLDEKTNAAWKQGGEMWEETSSRVVMARLKWIVRGQRKCGGSRESSDVFVLCAYGPTAKAPLRGSIFNNPILSILTKRAVYRAAVLAVLVYGAKAWAEHVRRLTTFHNRCVRTILGVTRYEQWEQRLTSTTLANRFSMDWSGMDIIMDRRLQWLGHLGCMHGEKLPKKMLFGERRKKRPCHGTKKRWRDQISRDLQAIGLKEGWYKLCQDRKEWLVRCREGVDEVPFCIWKRNTCAANRRSQDRSFACGCGRTFRRQGDLTRHKRFCLSER